MFTLINHLLNVYMFKSFTTNTQTHRILQLLGYITIYIRIAIRITFGIDKSQISVKYLFKIILVNIVSSLTFWLSNLRSVNINVIHYYTQHFNWIDKGPVVIEL